MFYFLLENATRGVPISFLLPGTSKTEHELQIEIELSNLRLKNGPQNMCLVASSVPEWDRDSGREKLLDWTCVRIESTLGSSNLPPPLRLFEFREDTHMTGILLNILGGIMYSEPLKNASQVV